MSAQQEHLHSHEPFDPNEHLAEVVTADGLAAKVAWPAVALAGVGAVVVVVGAVIKDTTVLVSGLAIIGATGLVQLPVGWKAPPPAVEHRVIDDSTGEREA